MMGELMTAASSVVKGDVFHTDRGNMVSGDIKVAGISHPPYLEVLESNMDMDLTKLSPPKKIVRNWVVEMANGTSIPEAWKKIEYERRYKEFLSSDKATGAITRLRRVVKHNDVVIVCGCDPVMSYYCPRRIIYERILNEDFTLSERLMRLQE